MGSFSLENVFNILVRIVFGSVIVVPLSLSNYNLSHQEGLNLKYSKTSPPLAIFDDEKISLNSDGEEIVSTVKRANMESNRIQTRKMVQKISKRFARLQKEAAKFDAPKTQVRLLAGISLNKTSSNIEVLKKAPAVVAAVIAKNPIKPPPPETMVSSKPVNADRQIFEANLAPQLRDRIDEIENFDEVYTEEYGTESFEQKARTVLSQEGVDPDSPSEREIANTYATATGSKRVSYSQRMNAAQERAERWANNFSNNRLTRGNGKNNPKPEETESIPKSDDQSGIDQKSEEKGAVIASRDQRQVIIGGTLEMTRGLALTGDQKIVVYRQIGGTRYGYGQVFVDQGRYEILVEEPNTGVVIAELIEKDTMIGRAEILMPEVMNNIKSEKDLKNISIKVSPILDQVVAENISAYSYYKKEKLKNSQLKIGNVMNANQKIFNSSIIMKATKENHWGNIILGSSRQIFTHILNPDSTVQALKDILGIKTSKEDMGIIKGEVSILGKTVADAEIEIIGHDARPVYFNSFIPDASLKQTSENGQFAIVDIPEGNYLIRAKYRGKYLSPQVAPVEPGFVTQVQFDVQKPNLAEAFVFDIQTSNLMNANINFLGSGNRVPIQSRKLISFSGGEGIQFLEVQAQDQNYYTTRLTVDKSEKEILIPMISQEWLNDLMARLRISSIPDTGLIIGTALELPYSVELDPGAYNEDTKIIYFDNQGKMVPGAMITPQGGGFVAVNVNQGIRSLFNKYHGTQNVKITTMAVDNSAINVFTSKF